MIFVFLLSLILVLFLNSFFSARRLLITLTTVSVPKYFTYSYSTFHLLEAENRQECVLGCVSGNMGNGLVVVTQDGFPGICVLFSCW